MADELFELMTKMYSEFSEFKKETKGEFRNMGSEIKEISQSQKKMELKIEHQVIPKIQALFESKDIIYDKLESLEKKVDKLSGQVERQEFEIKVIKGGRSNN